MRTQLSYSFKVFPWLNKKFSYQILFILLKTTQQIFCKLCTMHSSGAMTHSRQTFWIEQGHEILIFQTVNCNVCKSWLALGSLPCSCLHYIAQQSQLSTEPILLQSQLTIQACFISNCRIYELMKYITEIWGVKRCSAIHRFKIK